MDNNNTHDESLLNHPQKYVPKNGEAYMSEAQLNYFKEILSNWKKNLLDEANRTVSHLKDADRFSDPNDRASQETEVGLELRACDRGLKLIKKIDETLEKIDLKEYGYCEDCGEDIGFKRLEARPTASLCIECKTIQEKREKHMSD